MAYQISCPCGLQIAALDDDFVETVNAHLQAEHGRTYASNEIMMMALPVPDRVVTERS